MVKEEDDNDGSAPVPEAPGGTATGVTPESVLASALMLFLEIAGSMESGFFSSSWPQAGTERGRTEERGRGKKEKGEGKQTTDFVFPAR